MLFQKEDFKDLHYKVFDLEPNDYDKLLEMDQFRGIDLSMVHKQKLVKAIKYLVFMYDKNTPLVTKYPDIEERKKVAVTLASLTNQYNADVIEDLRELRDPYFDILMGMLRKQNEPVFNMLITQEELFNECMNKMLRKVEEDSSSDELSALEKKGKISNLMEETIDRIDRFRSRYYGSDDELAEKGRKYYSTTPEGIAFKGIQ